MPVSDAGAVLNNGTATKPGGSTTIYGAAGDGCILLAWWNVV